MILARTTQSLTTAALLLCVAIPAHADGDNTLGEFVNASYPGGGVVVAGDGTSGRVSGGQGPQTQADLVVAIPAGATVEAAYVYVGTIGTTDQPSLTLSLDGNSVTAAKIGQGGHSCWGNSYLNRAYRGDVTAFVSGSGTYVLTGFPSTTSAADDSQGVALVVIYSDASAGYETRIVLNDGMLVSNDAGTISNSLGGFTATDPVVDAHLYTVVGDGQSYADSLLFAGTTVAPDAYVGAAGEMFDVRDDVVTSLLSPGATTANTTINASSDCLAWMVNGLSFAVWPDTDMDGQTDNVDDDDDNDGVDDAVDIAPLDPTRCQDSEGDGCDDCAVGVDGFGPLSDVLPDNDGVNTDGDGQCDFGDPDDDNDGVTDASDIAPLDPTRCQDSEGDGCDDCAVGVDGFGPLSDVLPDDDGVNTDGDGQCDFGDPDDDNDGVTDASDIASLDPTRCEDRDGDGCDDCAVGVDGFGPLSDAVPAADGVDTDHDGQCDFGDLDDDNDGVVDTADVASLDPGRCQDGDGDGCDDCVVGTDGFGPLSDVAPAADGLDTDHDGQCDFGDPDDDNDGVLDTADVASLDPGRCQDIDGDGCDDCVVGTDGFGPLSDVAPAADGLDTDHDGQCDAGDLDDDNDGVLDTADVAPLDPGRCQDTDGDGCDDCSVGTDGFGPLPDYLPGNDGPDADADGVCDASDLDADGDGITNVDEGMATNVDTDGDGTPDYLDVDTDNDGILDEDEAGDADLNTSPVDTDGDGTADFRDVDSDGDNILDADESGDATAETPPVDTDDDGTPDYLDPDSDGDGVDDVEEAGDALPETLPVDTDGDGAPDYLDPDSDDDTVPDGDDNCRLTPNTDQADTNGDGVGDACENDEDEDGVIDDLDNCPATPNADQADADDDGIGDACEADTDADGVIDDLDNCLTTPNADQADADDDGIGDVCEADTDADGVIDDLDNCPETPNADQADEDDDGVGDACDDTPPKDPVYSGGGGCGSCNAGSAPAPFSAVLLLITILGLAIRRRR